MRRSLSAMFVLAVGLPAYAVVNVNTAQQSDLQATQGLDKNKAKAIIEYRAQNGPIDDLAELGRVPGIGKDTLDKAADQVAFSGPAFVPPPKPAKAKDKPKK